jgi:hypothetical protein
VEKRAVVVENVAVRKKTACPGPYDVKVLRFVGIPPKMLQILPV